MACHFRREQSPGDRAAPPGHEPCRRQGGRPPRSSQSRSDAREVPELGDRERGNRIGAGGGDTDLSKLRA
jgi:hypothetical protein